MILKVEIDLEDLTRDLFNGEEYSLKEGVISSIRREVVAEIKRNCSEQIQTQIRSIVEVKVGILIKNTERKGIIMTDREKIKEEIEKHMDELYPMLPDAHKVLVGLVTVEELQCTAKYRAYERILRFIEDLPKESEEDKQILDKATEFAKAKEEEAGFEFTTNELKEAFVQGAKWKEERLINMLGNWLEDFICDWVEIDRKSLIRSFNNYYNSNGDIFGVNRNFKEK